MKVTIVGAILIVAAVIAAILVIRALSDKRSPDLRKNEAQ